MATQSLYRRYRPRRFSEVKGQEHVVRALRNAVINHREGQAYLFSGPRGTGKTTSARILAKVLNCERPVEGEPCCECDSCIAVENGTSYDVHELDAASNNGVDAMRDLIEKASLGTPGRHKVYILDEVHMLSKGASAALLKTLEEPPPHVVFVLATTDPQKVADTIRSRTQHLQFHLLPMDVLEEHIRWLAGDAGIEVDDAAIQSVLRQGGGSARDTVSALELVASSGGDLVEATPLDEFVESFIAHDPGRALSVVALAVQQGREARLLTDDIIRHLRDCFLSLMAPELVQLTAQRLEEVQALASRLGAAGIVRAMERLGEMLVEMRYAPDPRLLLEVALVQLTHEAMQSDTSVILSRLDRVEQAIGSGATTTTVAAQTTDPKDPTTGRAILGGKVGRTASAPTDPAPVEPQPLEPQSAGQPTRAQPTTRPQATDGAPTTPAADTTAETARPIPVAGTASEAPAQHEEVRATPDDAIATAAARWSSDVLPALRGLARPMFSAVKVLGERDGKLLLGAPNEPHRARSAAHVADVESVIARVVGVPVGVHLVVDDDGDAGPGGAPEGAGAGSPRRAPSSNGSGATANVVDLASRAASGGRSRSTEREPGPDDDEPPSPPEIRTEDHELVGVDPHQLDDVPAEAVVGPVDRLLQAFPGSQQIDERN